MWAQKDRDKVLFIGAGCQWIKVHTTSGYRYCSNKVLFDDSGSFFSKCCLYLSSQCKYVFVSKEVCLGAGNHTPYHTPMNKDTQMRFKAYQTKNELIDKYAEAQAHLQS